MTASDNQCVSSRRREGEEGGSGGLMCKLWTSRRPKGPCEVGSSGCSCTGFSVLRENPTGSGPSRRAKVTAPETTSGTRRVPGTLGGNQSIGKG